MKQNLLSAFFLFAAFIAPASATTILIDFGSTATPGTSPKWNSITTYGAGLKTSNLRTTEDAETLYSLNIITSGFSGNVGETNTTLTPSTAYGEGFFGAYQTSADAPSTIRLSGLDPAISYTFTFYGSVDRSSTRGSRYTIGSQYEELEANDNASTLTSPITATPDSFGVIDIVVSRSSFNSDQSYMLNVIQIEYNIPEPSTVLLGAVGLLPLLRRRR